MALWTTTCDFPNDHEPCVSAIILPHRPRSWTHSKEYGTQSIDSRQPEWVAFTHMIKAEKWSIACIAQKINLTHGNEWTIMFLEYIFAIGVRVGPAMGPRQAGCCITTSIMIREMDSDEMLIRHAWHPVSSYGMPKASKCDFDADYRDRLQCRTNCIIGYGCVVRIMLRWWKQLRIAATERASDVWRIAGIKSCATYRSKNILDVIWPCFRARPRRENFLISICWFLQTD